RRRRSGGRWSRFVLPRPATRGTNHRNRTTHRGTEDFWVWFSVPRCLCVSWLGIRRRALSRLCAFRARRVHVIRDSAIPFVARVFPPFVFRIELEREACRPR